MQENNNAFKIAENQRQGWFSITMVWAGAMICVSCLMVGGLLGSYLTLGECAIAILIGYGLVALYMSLIGMQGCDLGLPTSVMAGSSLGQKGAKYIISVLLAIACIGWFGVQSAVCGISFSTMFAVIFNVNIPVWVSIVFWGVIMLLTACYGFKGLKLLNIVAVPLLVIVCIYGLVLAIVKNDGMELIKLYKPVTEMGLVFGINYTIATFALGGVIAGDYCRFAKSRADVIKSSFIGVIPAGFLILMIGAILTVVTGQYDISTVFVSFGSAILGILGLLALIAGTWTTNVTNAYTGGIALSVLLGLSEEKKKIPTAIAGAVGIIVALIGSLAAAGFYSVFQQFLTILCAFIPPLAGTMIADYWIVGKGKKENFSIKNGFYWPGMTAYLVGVVVACLTGGTFASYFPSLAGYVFFVGPINGIAVSFIVYAILGKVALKNKTSESV
ncbi:MAG: cytosine permease [Firmicutes bacterium HGW-Firmicutes-16]|nr:MAG: cytosine permease [Firmicutes bacterium HGW-Firmicutes-16]